MSTSAVQERFEMAMELSDLAEAMLREKVRRTHPELPESEVEARVDAWFMQRPGAEQGDGEGRPVSWPRRGK
jgi:hypothetical protein